MCTSLHIYYVLFRYKSEVSHQSLSYVAVHFHKMLGAEIVLCSCTVNQILVRICSDNYICMELQCLFQLNEELRSSVEDFQFVDVAFIRLVNIAFFI